MAKLLAKRRSTRGARKRAAGPPVESEYLLAAAYLAIIAYPSESEISKRDKFVEAAKAHILKLALRRGWMRREDNCWPDRSSWTNKKIDDVINSGWRRIRARRIPAAELFMVEYFRLNNSPVGVVRQWMRTAKIINRIDDEAESADKNVMHRVRKESMPVLHMAVGLLNVLPPGKVGAYRLLSNTAWVSGLRIHADAWKKAIIKQPRYRMACAQRLPRIAG